MTSHQMQNAGQSSHPGLTRVLLYFALFEGILFLALVGWLGFLHLALAGLLKQVFAWSVCLAAMAVISAIAWRFYTFARRRRFRLSLRTLLIVMCVLSVLLAIIGKHVAQLHEQEVANRAVSHIRARSGVIYVGSPIDAPYSTRIDWTDLRNAVSVSFNGTTLNESDFAQLARIPSLVAVTIKNAPIGEQNFLLLQHLPNLQYLVLENTGASAATLEVIDKMRSRWQVFRNRDELKRWSLARVREMQTKEEL